jgi:hypothetical protein
MGFVMLLGACVADEEPDYSSEEQAVRYDNVLAQDLPLYCGDNTQVAESITSSQTKFNVSMCPGDTVWVSGAATIEYSYDDANYSKVFVETQLACKAGTTTTNNPAGGDVHSRSGMNHWKRVPYGSRITATHNTRAVFTAPAGTPCNQTYTCWLVYSCKPKTPPGDSLTIKAGTTLTHYDVNQYPGINWKPSSGHIVDSTTAVAPGGSQLWDAGTSTASDTEVVAAWLPRLTACVPGDEDPVPPNNTPGECVDATQLYEEDTYFDWRFWIYQYADGALCNTTIGAWNPNVKINWNDHHHDITLYSMVAPIVTGAGNFADCGDDATSRSFRVYPYIRKTIDAGYSDIMVHTGSSTNLFIYSR